MAFSALWVTEQLQSFHNKMEPEKRKKTIISDRKENILTGVRETIIYKDLLIMMAWRDFKVRYSQTFLGLSWALFQPLTSVLIFWLIFNRGAGVQTENIPYAVFALSGIALWSLFSYIFSQASNSVISAQSMIKKIYFPRIILPLSKGLVGLIDFMVAFGILLVFMFLFHVPFKSQLLFLPLILILTLLFSFSLGVLVSALSIRYRDVIHVLPFILQIGMYVSPIAYPSSFILNKLPAILKYFYVFNPMVGIIDLFRWCLFGTVLNPDHVFISVLLTVLLLFFSVRYFFKVESVMSDLI